MSGNSLPRLGDYLLIERVGEGGMAEVFRAQYSGEDHSVGPQSVVVVKRIKPDLFTKPEFPIFREMFLNEAKLVRSLQQHPNLARVYALLEAVDPELKQKVPFIVQEYVRGQQLWELLRIATRGFTGLGVPPGVAAFIGREIALGLGHAHTHKDAVTGRLQPIIHRDISPENVMVSVEGHIKVIDFGVAKALGGFGPQTRTGIIKGKLAYMAPEQVAQKVVPATDVFGAGIVLHEMLTGRRLFGGHNDFMVISRVLKAEIPRPSQLQSGIPPELDDVVMTALTRDLRTRYLDGNAFAAALTRVMAKLPDMRGINTATIKQWSKQVVSEGVKISANWGEEESGVFVDVDVTGAIRKVEGSGDDIIELGADDLMQAELDGTFDPGVRAAVTQGLKTLRPDMLASRQSLSPINPDGSSSSSGISANSLPGFARPNAIRPAQTPAPAPEPLTSSSNLPLRPTPPPNQGTPVLRKSPTASEGHPVVPTSNFKPSSGYQRISTHLPPVSGPAQTVSESPSRSSNPSGSRSATELGNLAKNSPPGTDHPSATSNPSGLGRQPLSAGTSPGASALLELLAAPLAGPATASGPMAKAEPAPPSGRLPTVPATISPTSPNHPQKPATAPTAKNQPAFFDKQIEQWVKFIGALLALALVLIVLLLLRN